MRTRFLAVAISSVAMLTAGCDPEAPVQSSDVSQEIESAVAVHAADSTTHTNLLLPAANVSGEFDSDQIADGAIGNSELDINSVGSEEIADQTIALADMGAGSVGAAQIVDLSITSGKLALGSIGPAQIAANSIGAGQMAAGAISGGVAGTITDNTIGTADIQNGSVASLDIAADTITGANIANDILDDADIVDDGLDNTSLATGAVQAAEIAANAVITAKIMDANVTTNKLAALGITQPKLDTDWAGERMDAATGAFDTVFTFNQPAGGMPIDVTVWGACESDVAGSKVRILDADAQNDEFPCPDTNLNGPPDLFRVTIVGVANAKTVKFEYDAGANNGIVRWRIYGISLSGDP